MTFTTFIEKFDPNDPKNSFSYWFFESFKSTIVKSVSSPTQMRKIYDGYLVWVYATRNLWERERKFMLWRARIVDKETSNSDKEKVEKGFADFLEKIFNKLWNDYSIFKEFLEMYLIYHKTFIASSTVTISHKQHHKTYNWNNYSSNVHRKITAN
jgi:CRISPR/Cas system CSM-associated protein Csm2 small subunit